MKRRSYLLVLVIISILLTCSCEMIGGNNLNIQSTEIALQIQSTQLALQMTQIALQSAGQQQPSVPEQLPTYTPYPTYTVQAPPEIPAQLPTAEPTAVPTEVPTATLEATLSFEEWKDDAKILLYDSMYQYSDSGNMIYRAIDGLGLSRNVINTKDAMGNFLKELNSGTQWDLIIVGGEAHEAISGDFFTALQEQVERGTSMIIEIWYLSDIYFGKVQPLMQYCGIEFQSDWQRPWNDNLNKYLIYLLDTSHPLFSTPNTISMLIPTTAFWWSGDVGDRVRLVPGSEAKILAGSQQKEYTSYGLISECLDGRMIWQTFDTHDYKYNDMINIWQNYVINTLQARYDFVINQ